MTMTSVDRSSASSSWQPAAASGAVKAKNSTLARESMPCFTSTSRHRFAPLGEPWFAQHERRRNARRPPREACERADGAAQGSSGDAQ